MIQLYAIAPLYNLTQDLHWAGVVVLEARSGDRDYLFFALQIDFPGKLNPQVEVDHSCDRWMLSVGDFYKALGDLKNKGVVVAIASLKFVRSFSTV